MAVPIVRERLAQGGARLSLLLNQTLAVDPDVDSFRHLTARRSTELWYIASLKCPSVALLHKCLCKKFGHS